MQRRHFHRLLAAGLLAPLAPALAHAGAAEGDSSMLALAWRGPAEGDAHHAGRLRIDWAAGSIAILHAATLPGRPHGLMLDAAGSLLVVAVRPGAWLLRIDAHGQVQRLARLDDEPDGHRLDGHAILSPDGAHVITTQTDMRTGAGHVALRDRDTLALQARWPTHGIDPHQLLLDDAGAILVANGGIPRDSQGRKRELDRMQPSLVRLDARDGRLLGQWAPADRRLSMRHLAWSRPAEGGTRTLGIALQAEHDEPSLRARAPLLALWSADRTGDGALRLAPAPAGAAGYAGDIAPAADGGFVLSAQRANRVLHWRGGAEEAGWALAGQLGDPCALGALADAEVPLVFAGGRGVGRWHPARPAAMLPWPQPMAVDNHCILIDDATA